MKVKLGDIFEIGSGGTPSKSHPEYYKGNIPWVKTGDLKSEYLYEVEDFISEEGLKNSSAKMYEENTVLIAMYGATIGATSILKLSACTNQACAAFKENENVIPEYLYYFLRSQKERFVKDGVGGAQPNISAGYLKKVEMEIPSLENQKEIIGILDKISEIISRMDQEIRLLDNLIKARFVEMFGDPVANDMGWETLPLENACKAIVDCPHSTPSYTNEDTGFMCIRTSIVKKNKILWDDIEYIPKDEFEKRIQRRQPVVGDVVYTREGAILGIAAIIDRDCNVALGQRLMLLSPDIDKCASEFLCIAMNSDSFLDNALKGVSGSASPHINVGDIKAFRMIMPPIELQNQFADFVKQVDKSKFNRLNSLNKKSLNGHEFSMNIS